MSVASYSDFSEQMHEYILYEGTREGVYQGSQGHSEMRETFTSLPGDLEKERIYLLRSVLVLLSVYSVDVERVRKQEKTSHFRSLRGLRR